MAVVSYPLPNFDKLAEVEAAMMDGGKVAVIPTKVGYIITATDMLGMEKKFALKGRPLTKPGVVLTYDLGQFNGLVTISDEHDRKLVEEIYSSGILCGFILPWKQEAMRHYVPSDLQSLMQDGNGTSCFVFNHGTYSEELARRMLEHHDKLVFASSANPSGQGNRGRFEGIGEGIINGADVSIEADKYVSAQQPAKDESTRFEQGVMVSLVTPRPTVIRTGLDVGEIVGIMARVYGRSGRNRAGTDHLVNLR